VNAEDGGIRAESGERERVARSLEPARTANDRAQTLFTDGGIRAESDERRESLEA